MLRKIQLDDIITHRLSVSEISHIDILNKKEDRCVEVVMEPWK